MRKSVAYLTLIATLAGWLQPPAARAEETVSIKSPVIKEASYDAESRTLVLVFTSGMRYAYRDVPPAIFAGLKRTEHPGAYFHDYIRPRYVGTPELAGISRPAPRRIRCVAATGGTEHPKPAQHDGREDAGEG